MKSNSPALYIVVVGLVSVTINSCLTIPKSQQEIHAKYSHTVLQPGEHYLAYNGEISMSLEVATDKWLAKAEKLCKSREFDYEINKQELRGKDYSEDKYPFIEGNLYCIDIQE